jgi:hypothetical protein
MMADYDPFELTPLGFQPDARAWHRRLVRFLRRLVHA